jgi:cytochrome c biogenesis protein CcmG/thiol:disulfide interchange protein DsbE
MGVKKRIIIIFFVSMVFLTAGLLSCQGQIAAGSAGSMSPDFMLKDVYGNSFRFASTRGKVVILDFWATWCPPCRASIPELVKMQEKYKDKGLVILGISTDDTRKVNNEYLQGFCKKFNINYGVLRFDLDVIDAYFGREAPALPTMFVIDKAGQVRDKFQGFSPDALEKSLERLFE